MYISTENQMPLALAAASAEAEKGLMNIGSIIFGQMQPN